MNEFTDTKSSELYMAAVGQKNQNYYVTKFEDFDQQGEGFHASWNWAAFFFGGAWALYRKMYIWFFAWWGVAIVATVLEQGRAGQLQQIFGLIVLLLWLAFGAFANSLYHTKVKAKIAAARKSSSDVLNATNRLSGSGGVLAWVPFVFIGIPTIGILAAVIFSAYKDHATPKTTVVMELESKAPTNIAVDSDKVVMAPPAKPMLTQAERGSSEQYQYQDGVAALKRGDYASAAVVFHPLAHAGHAEAQFSLGSMYRFGNGVAKDDTVSTKWYRLAANQGHALAQSQLGLAYESGEGVLQNYSEAVTWHRMAAVQGDSLGQNQLGLAYALGRGVQQDYVRAHMWFNLAGATGAAGASTSRETIADSMSPQQIAQAQQMARDCLQRNFQGCD